LKRGVIDRVDRVNPLPGDDSAALAIEVLGIEIVGRRLASRRDLPERLHVVARTLDAIDSPPPFGWLDWLSTTAMHLRDQDVVLLNSFGSVQP